MPSTLWLRQPQILTLEQSATTASGEYIIKSAKICLEDTEESKMSLWRELGKGS